MTENQDSSAHTDEHKMVLQHPVPTQHLRHIGDITVCFALLERDLQSLAGSMIREHQRIGQIITAELSFRSLRALVASLYLERHGEDDDCATLRELLRRAGQVEETRNQITHSVWGAAREADAITRIKATAKEKRGMRFTFEKVTSQDLERFANEIKELTLQVSDFWLSLVLSGKAASNSARKSWGTLDTGLQPP